MKSAAALSPYFLEERAFMRKIKAKDKKAALKNIKHKTLLNLINLFM